MDGMKKSAFDIKKISKFVAHYENAAIIMLMVLAGICYKFDTEAHPYLIPIGFLSLVIVEGKNLISKWNKSSKRGFLTAGNVIGLVFLGVLLAVGMYATFIIFYVKNFLTINFLGIFGIIWTLRWIQKLKNFSSIRDDVHKLIGPIIAIVILISGYALHSKNTAFGPFSCVLAPAMMWFCSFIFGDIKGRSNDQEDEISLFAIILSIILLSLVIYAILKPDIYGIKVMDVDGQFFKDLYVAEKKSLSSALEARRAHLIEQAKIDIVLGTKELEVIDQMIADLNEQKKDADEQLRKARSSCRATPDYDTLNNAGNIATRIDEIESQIKEKNLKRNMISFDNATKQEELQTLEDKDKSRDVLQNILREYFIYETELMQESIFKVSKGREPSMERLRICYNRASKLEDLKDAYSKSIPETTTESTIISWLRSFFRNSKEANEAK